MNRLLTLCLLLLSGIQLSAQFTPSPPTDIENISLEDKSWIMSKGFPLTDYDYKDVSINHELSTALFDQKQGTLFANAGWIGMGLGVLLLFTPSDVDIDRSTIRTAYGVMLIGGATLNLVGRSKQSKAKKRVENARFLFYNKK